MATAALDGFHTAPFVHEGKSYPVHRRGHGPGVVIIHEIPGLHPAVIEFGQRVAEAGFTAVLPELFGSLGRPVSAGYLASSMLRACISREFSVLARNESSPITDWLRALCRQTHTECGGPGVGALGMCLTGNFALALMVDECVVAPVLSQPSLPFPISRPHRAALHLTPGALDTVKRRVAGGCPVLAMRFSHDPLCPGERFATLRRELGAGFEGIEIDSSKGNPHGIPRTAHSVLTVDLVDREGHPTRAALERTLAFLRERLSPTTGP